MRFHSEARWVVRKWDGAGWVDVSPTYKTEDEAHLWRDGEEGLVVVKTYHHETYI